MAGTITVSTLAQLYQALANATGGETIQLAGGDYGKLALSTYSSFDVDFPSNVTITSADPLNPARFSGLSLTSVSNLTIDGVVCDYTFKPGDPLYTAPFKVYGSHDVVIRNSTFDGDLASGLSAADDGYAAGIGLSISKSTGITVEGNDISSFYRGITVFDSTGIDIAGNDLHEMRSDGMNFSQVADVTIEANHIHDFHTAGGSGDHPDMIQFWTAGTTKPSTDIVIRGNVLDLGEGTWTQSIFMGNELVSQGLAGPEMFYQNVTIDGNVIVNGQSHGITLGQTNGLVIQQNSVLHSDGSNPDGADNSVEIPAINVSAASTNVSITGNVTSAINGWTTQPTWTVSQNAFVQDQNPGAPGYYGDVFISSSLTAQDGVHSFLARPGGMIDLLSAGATQTRELLPDSGTVAALFQVSAGANGATQTRAFDASLCLSDIGTLPAGTVFEWAFGDGTTATGVKVVHNFPAGGHFDVSLTVRTPDGVTDTVVGTIGIQESSIVTLGADGAFRATEYEQTILLPTTLAASSAGIDLGATGVAATIASTHVTDLLLTKDFEISMQLQATTSASIGEVFRLHGGIVASVTLKGELMIQTTPTVGSMVQFISTGIKVNDMKSHEVDIRLHDGVLQLWLDGKLASQAAFAGTMHSFGPTSLTFGNPWGGKNFDGDLTAFDITVGKNDFDGAKTILTLGHDGSFQSTGHAIAPALAAETDTDTTSGLHLGGSGLAASVAGSTLTDLLHTERFEVAMTLDADSADSAGVIFRMADTLVSRVLATGQLVIRAFEQDGSVVRLTSAGTPFTDLQSHDIDIRLLDGKLQLWVDNTLSSEAAFDGSLRDLGPRDLEFGTRTSTTAFHGDLTAFDVMVTADSAWTSPSSVVL
jgi:parallel beta-helix repeat protein